MGKGELDRIRYATEHFKTFSGLTWIPVFCLLPLMDWLNVALFRVHEPFWVTPWLEPVALAGLALAWWALYRHQIRRFGRVEPNNQFRRRLRWQSLVLGLAMAVTWAGAFWLHEPGDEYEFYWIWFGLLLVGAWWIAGLRVERSYLALAGLALVSLAFVLPPWLATSSDALGGFQTEPTRYLVVRSAVEVSIGLIVGLLDYRALVRVTRPIGHRGPEGLLQGGEAL